MVKKKTPKWGKIGAPKSVKRKKFLAKIRKKRTKSKSRIKIKKR